MESELSARTAPSVLAGARDLERAPPDLSAASWSPRVHGTQPAKSNERAIAHGSSSRSAAASDRASSSSLSSRSASTLIAMSPRNRSASESVQASSSCGPELRPPGRAPRCRRVLGEPIPGLADPRQRARLADAPRVLGAGERERRLVEVDRRPALHPPPRAVARGEQRVGRRAPPARVLAVEVERRVRRGLEVVGGPGRAPARTAGRRSRCEPEPFALGQARVRDVAQDVVPEAPAGDDPCVLLAHDDLGVIELLDLVVARRRDGGSSSRSKSDGERPKAPGEVAMSGRGRPAARPPRPGRWRDRAARRRWGRSRSSMPVDSTMKNGLPPARS